MSRTVIAGGGFGGISAALELRRLVGPDHEIVVVDRDESFMMGLRKLWALIGYRTMEEGRRPRAHLAEHGITFEQRAIGAIDPPSRTLVTDDGTIEGDHLVIALGAVPRPDLVTGLAEHAHDVWNSASVPAASAALEAFDGGTIAVVIAGGPYTCPPAPFECAFLIDEHLRSRGLRDRSDLMLTTFQPILMPNAGQDGSAMIGGMLSERGVSTRTGAAVKRVEGGRVVFEDGNLDADLIVGVPPHRPPAVVTGSGLTGDGPFIPVDRGTLATSTPGVWAVGDCTQITLDNGMPFPKAGVVAELEGLVVARGIAAILKDESAPPPFDGTAHCFIETGTDEAAMFEAEFFAADGPKINFADATTETSEEKHRFERDRLGEWFPG